MNYFGLSLIAILFFCSCKEPSSESSFYYWKTHFKLSSSERNILHLLGSKTVYVRFFDVDISKETNLPVPLGIINNVDSVPKETEIIPVVFITNRTFLNLSKQTISLLAEQVLSKINSIKNKYSELQFDCDWSDRTRDNYFYFLKQIRLKNKKSVKLSATIRLHQIKYYKKTGIPPVNRGMIMFYNMGDLANPESENSIYNKKSSDKYITYVKKYPLNSDVALPIFGWFVHYKDEKISGLIAKNNIPNLKDSNHFLRVGKSTTFIAANSFFENGIYYKKGDRLRGEKLSAEELIEAAKSLQTNLRSGKRKIVFYDLDEININTYDEKTFKKILAIFN